ncbi:MAG: DNA polymerase III subunit delta [Parcubacteria group bacterium Gr01-1014_106]|nr:MAG: DNA polymerase III subunit delta [Parcubacteria group bacterium Gr01-1014_106]
MITVFYGEDTYRSRAAFRAAREKSASSGTAVRVLRDEQLTPSALHAALSGATLFGALPPVAVERLTSFTGTSASAIAEMLRTVPKDSALLVWEENIPAANGIVWRALQEHADLQHVPSLSGAALMQWISERAEAHGVTITPDAQEALIARCGANLWMMTAEMEKLSLAARADGITLTDVVENVSLSPSTEIFGVVRAIVHGEKANALRLLTTGVLAGEEPRRVFFLVLRELSALVRIAQRMQQRGSLSAWDVAREFRLPKTAADTLLHTARQVPARDIRALFDRAIVAYYHLNTGRADAAELLETMVLESKRTA